MSSLSPDDELFLCMMSGVAAFHFDDERVITRLIARRMVERYPGYRKLWRLTPASRAALQKEGRDG